MNRFSSMVVRKLDLKLSILDPVYIALGPLEMRNQKQVRDERKIVFQACPIEENGVKIGRFVHYQSFLMS